MLVTLAVGRLRLLLPRLRPRRDHPHRGRRPRRHQRDRAAPLLPLRGLHPRETRSRTECSRSPTLFPIRHFFEAFFTAWDPSTTGAGFEWGDLAVVAAWGLAGLVDRGLALPLGAAALTPSPLAQMRWPYRQGPSRVRRLPIRCSTTQPSRSPTSSAAARFYDSILAPLGWRRQEDRRTSICWGLNKSEFFITLAESQRPGYGLVSFPAKSIPAVKASYESGLANGGESAAEPGSAPAFGSRQLRGAPARTRTATWSSWSSPTAERPDALSAEHGGAGARSSLVWESPHPVKPQGGTLIWQSRSASTASGASGATSSAPPMRRAPTSSSSPSTT